MDGDNERGGSVTRYHHPHGQGTHASIGETHSAAMAAAAEQQLGAWNATQQDYVRDRCVPHLVAKQAAATPDAVAVVAGDRMLSYQELHTRATHLAHHLRALGVGPDVLVGLCLERSIEMVVGALGILTAGGAYVALDPAYPPDRLAFMLHDAQALVLLTQQSVVERLPGGAWQVVVLDAEAPPSLRVPVAPVPGDVKAEHLAYVIYTSGSTGQPKGVQITHDSLLNLVFWHQRAFAVTPADRATQLSSPGFDAAVWELWPYLTAGASVHLTDDKARVEPGLLRDWLVQQEITISFVPTALAESVIMMEWPPETALRVLLTGADTLHHYPPPDLPFALVNNYGPTESTVVATSGRVVPGTHLEGRPSIGRPIANTQVYILDEQLHPVPVGVPGELHIGGAGLARGYLNRPALTAEKFIRNPFSAVSGDRLYKTGDQAYYLPDGQIGFVGRIDDQVKIRGYRVEPGEIVTVLNRHPAVQTSLVVAREDVPGDRRLVAYIVPAAGPQPTAGALHDFLATQVPGYMVPSTFVCLQALPLTANGKVDRAALPPPDAANTLQDAAFTAPRTLLEERVAGIVAELLGLEQVGVDDNFFLLGGHSLLGAQVVLQVHETFGVDLPLLSLFGAPTVAQLAAEIERLILARLEAMSDDEVQRMLA